MQFEFRALELKEEDNIVGDYVCFHGWTRLQAAWRLRFVSQGCSALSSGAVLARGSRMACRSGLTHDRSMSKSKYKYIILD